jgi:hypothetical protein
MGAAILITDPVLKQLIVNLSAFERRCLERYLRGIGDSVGEQLFFQLKRELRERVRGKRKYRR